MSASPRVLAMALGLLSLASCSESTTLHPHPFEALLGTTVTDHPVLVTPDRHWAGNAGAGRWMVRGAASLLCFVNETPGEDLVLRLKPDAGTARLHVLAAWDGQPLGEARRLPPEGGEFRVPVENVGPGLHTLALRRAPRHDRPGEQEIRELVFESVALEVGEDRHVLHPRDLGRFTYLSSFLTFGLTGLGTQRMEGCLFAGPASTTVEVTVHAAGTVVFRVESFSTEPADFTAAADGKSASCRVDGKARADLALSIPAGTHSLSLRVEGPQNGLFLWGAPYFRTAAKPAGPILLITMDTTRRDALSPYGGPAAATPNIQGLAAHATVYDNAYATAPWTLPSHASMFTGLYPSEHGAGVRFDRLRREYETLAELLRRRGYFTAGFAGGAFSATGRGVGQGFLTYRDPDGAETRGDRLTDEVEAVLRAHRDDPLFLFVNYFDPHALYQAPPEFEARFDVPRLRQAIAHLPVWSEVSTGSSEAWGKVTWSGGQIDPAALAYLRAAYQAEVAFMDHQIGRIFDLLRELDLYESATIVLVSDHGEFLGEHGYLSHSARLDEELTAIPLLIKRPGQSHGNRVGQLASHVDLFPTLLEVAPNRSGLWLGPSAVDQLAARSSVYMEEHETWFHPLIPRMKVAPHLYGAQRLDWQEVVWQGGIACRHLTAGGWVDAPEVPDWKERMQAARDRAQPVPGTEGAAAAAAPQALSPEEEARLRSLGYVK